MRRSALALLLICMPASAATDYQCVQACTSQGLLYQYCVSQCSYDPTPQPRQRRIDYGCVQQCTARGFMYSYCVQACSY